MATRATLKRPKWQGLLIGGLLAGLLIWLGMQQAPVPSPQAQAAQALAGRALRVGVDPSYPPFASLDDGQWRGFDIELAQALAQRLDLKLEFVPISFDGLYDALKTGQADVIISALVYNPAKTAEVRYTRPYFDNGIVLVSLQSRPLASMFNIVGLRLAYAYGTDADTEARKWARRIADFEMMPYEFAQHALTALCLGHTDAALMDATSYYLHRQSLSPCDTFHRYVSHSEYVIAVSMGQEALSSALDRVLDELIRSGELDAIRSRWL